MEQWRSVVGYEELYQVSDQGRVRSLPRLGTKGGVLKHTTSRKGYQRVSLSKNGKTSKAYVHRLVLDAFVGSGSGLQGCHLNHDKADNRLNNLSWGTQQENMLQSRTDNAPNQKVKLTREAIVSIRDDPRPQKEIAAAHDTSQVNVSLIKRGKSWSWL